MSAASGFAGIGTWVAMASGDLFPFINVSATGVEKNSVATLTELIAQLKLNGVAGLAANTFTDAQIINLPSGTGNALSCKVAGTEKAYIRNDGWIVTTLGVGTDSIYTTGGGLYAGLGIVSGVNGFFATALEVRGPTAFNTSQALSGAGAVNVTTTVTKFTSTGGADALTLADGADGQIKIIIHAVDGGSGVLTPTTKTGFSTLTFTNAGDTAVLQFSTTIGWCILAVNGTVVA